MKVSKPNISTIAVKKLCNTCGACFGVCPVHAIGFQETIGGYYLPVVDEETCIHCGLCREVCPGIHFGETLSSKMPEDPFTGNVTNSFVGKATDKKFFDNSQSGGIVSALLAHSLKKGLIKGAVTVSMEHGEPPRPTVRIARSSSELYQSQKSKYCPVPLLGFIRELKEIKGPVAVVGTACQMHGLQNILDNMPKLQNKIAFTVGLVCDRVMTYAALDFLLSRSGKEEGVSSTLHFRDKSVSGYPGDVHVIAANGSSIVMPAATRMQIKDYFTPARCRICFDKMNVFSDITVGDPHGLDGVDRVLGESMLLARTEKGLEVIYSAKNEKAINIRPIQYEQVLKGQGIDKKREQWIGYTEAWKKTGCELPAYYEKVKNNTTTLINNKKYMHNLQYSLRLDKFPSRENLIAYVHKALKKRQLFNRLFFSVRFLKMVIKKISVLIFRL